MTPQEVFDTLDRRFPGKITDKNLTALNPWIAVNPADFAEVARFCRDEPSLAFNYLRDLTAVDWLMKDEKKAQKLGVSPRLEVLYQLFSFTNKHHITLKVFVERWKGGREGDLPEVPTVSNIWRIAEWHEREVYDLLGVRFTGHQNLRRILCPEDWVGHPLRKDYVFPKEYHGIRW